MTFTNISQAFNHYRTASVADIERRAAEIKGIIESDPNADMASLNIEISGLQQAKENAVEKQTETRSFNPITGTNFERRASVEAIEGDVLSSVEYRNAFYKKLLGHKLNQFEEAAFTRAQGEQRADVFSTSGDVAAVIPTQTLNEVLTKARTMGGIMSVCRSFSIPAKLMIPVGTPSTMAKWNIEGAEVESEKPDVAGVSFDAFEILKVFSISAKVRRMSVPAFESYLAEELASCVMACIANGLVSGSGTDEGTGILPGVTWTTGENLIETGSIFSYENMVEAVALLKRGYANGAKWAMNNATLYRSIYALTDTTGKPLFITDPKVESIGKILGFEVVVDDYLEDDTILFGNFQYMAYNLPEGIAVEASTESSFKSGRIDYRALAIADCKPIIPEAFVKLAKV